MGSTLEARCSCGHTAYADVGAGMETFLSECLFPFHCPSCRSIVNADTMAASPTCPDCGSSSISPYSDASLAGDQGSEEVTSWNQGGDSSRPVSLSDGSYLCPACGLKNLRFTRFCCFD